MARVIDLTDDDDLSPQQARSHPLSAAIKADPDTPPQRTQQDRRITQFDGIIADAEARIKSLEAKLALSTRILESIKITRHLCVERSAACVDEDHKEKEQVKLQAVDDMVAEEERDMKESRKEVESARLSLEDLTKVRVREMAMKERSAQRRRETMMFKEERKGDSPLQKLQNALNMSPSHPEKPARLASTPDDFASHRIPTPPSTRDSLRITPTPGPSGYARQPPRASTIRTNVSDSHAEDMHMDDAEPEEDSEQRILDAAASQAKKEFERIQARKKPRPKRVSDDDDEDDDIDIRAAAEASRKKKREEREARERQAHLSSGSNPSPPSRRRSTPAEAGPEPESNALWTSLRNRGTPGNPIKDWTTPSLSLSSIINLMPSQSFPPSPHYATRADIAKVCGGQTQTTYPKAAIDKRSEHPFCPRSHYVCVKTSLNPLIPRIPGAAGILFQARRDIPLDCVFPLFVELGGPKTKWRYMGHYRCVGTYEVPVSEWRGWQERIKNDWSAHVVSKLWGRKLLQDCGAIQDARIKPDAEVARGAFDREVRGLRAIGRLLEAVRWDKGLYKALSGVEVQWEGKRVRDEESEDETWEERGKRRRF